MLEKFFPCRGVYKFPLCEDSVISVILFTLVVGGSIDGLDLSIYEEI
jgi:hypothetical protein